jgi:hypothetical protein
MIENNLRDIKPLISNFKRYLDKAYLGVGKEKHRGRLAMHHDFKLHFFSYQ